MPSRIRRLWRSFSLLLLWVLVVRRAESYSVLSHEALIDALWDTKLQPILLKKFPGSTPAQLKQAHGYAYGGAIIQDMGFYPHGNGYFSDLTHYARSGDFIEALVSDSQTLDELAFALGALAHFAGDCDGHRFGTNVAEAQVYPKLGKKFGAFITYEDDPDAHLKTEFGFDVVEVAKGNYAPEAYHDFIGFFVATPLLERAFRETYGFDLRTMFNDLPEAIGSYRRVISNLIPMATRVAWAQHGDEIQRARPGITRKRFLYVMRRSSYERDWGKQYDRPNLWERILAFLLKLLPPIGPLKTLRFAPLTPGAEQEFMRSFELAVATYTAQLNAASRGGISITNANFDTGAITPPASYRLQDEAYAYWVDQLVQTKFAFLTPRVRDRLLEYYRDRTLPFATKKHKKNWSRLLKQLEQLESASLSGG